MSSSLDSLASNKSSRIAFLSFFSIFARVLSGPITLIFVASCLSEIELGYYYIFFSVIASIQLLEVGLGNVIRQFYAHSKSEEDTERYFSFSLIYYLAIGVIFSIASCFFDGTIFGGENKDLWHFPWLILIAGTFLKNITLPFGAYLDGNQKQLEYQKINIFSSLSATASLWLSLNFDLGLYSIAIFQLVGATSFLLLSLRYVKIKVKYREFIPVLKEVWPLMKKTIIVWLMGYFFWNGFNIIAFKSSGAEMAGKIGYSLAIARAGYDIVATLFINQMTLLSNLISKGNITESRMLYKRYVKICSLLCILGYFSFIFVKILMPDLSFINKTLSLEDLLFLFFYFYMVVVMAINNNYIRCYKVEPFVFLSIYNATIIPLSFWLSILLGFYYFSLPSVAISISVFISILIFKNFMEKNIKHD
ncbi:hypothetical protein V4D09_10120 [Vibrio mimicus]|uniref:hypothetical protein n=1 Tax=Vibrio mimicus TaxID=674 RepID=UPI002F93D022